MGRFTTTIKTNYTNMSVDVEKKAFTSRYSSKNGRRIIAGDNRSSGKKYASRLIK